MPRGTFHQWYKSGGTPVVQLRMSDYFVLTDQDKNIHGGMRIGAHTDPCGFTILWSNGPPGLEVAVGEVDFNSTILTPLFDHWVPIQTNPDALIINAGDFYRFWTNGHWKSSYHRVIPLPERRISMVYFTSPGYSARSDNVLPSAVTAGEFKFPSITIADKLEHSRQVAEVFKSENSMLL